MRPYAKRLPKGRNANAPGEIVQLDILSICPGPGRPHQAVRRLRPVGQVDQRSSRALHDRQQRLLLEELKADLPFPIQAGEVDGGGSWSWSPCKNFGIYIAPSAPQAPLQNLRPKSDRLPRPSNSIRRGSAKGFFSGKAGWSGFRPHG